MLEILFNKLYQKEAPTQVFSCECCEMFKHSFSYRNICEYEFFECYAMLLFFFRSALARRSWLKTTLPKNKSKQKL